MSSLRWSLLIVGGLLLLGIYLYGRWRGQTRPSDIFDDMGPADQDILMGKRGDPHLREKLSELNSVKKTDLFADIGGEPDADIKIGLKPSDMRGALQPLADQPAARPVILRKKGSVTESQKSETSVPPVTDDVATPKPIEPHAAVASETEHDRAESAPRKPPVANGVVVDEAPRSKTPPLTEDEHVVVMHIVAPKGKEFPGKAILKVFHANGLRFGNMNIFHRISKRDGVTHTVFSVASMVKPGTLDPKDVVTQSFPGISLFARLPNPEVGNIAAFDEMLHCAQHMVVTLGGELRDQKLRAMTHGSILIQRGNLRKRFPEKK